MSSLGAYLSFLVISFSLTGPCAFAQDKMAKANDNAEVTPIEGADLVCTRPGGMLAINAKDERVWQGDPGNTSGLELKINRFETFRCGPYCYDIGAELRMWGEVMNYRILTSYEMPTGKITAHLDLSRPTDPSKMIASFDFDCRPN